MFSPVIYCCLPFVTSLAQPIHYSTTARSDHVGRQRTILRGMLIGDNYT
jgi:hypothetical protein